MVCILECDIKFRRFLIFIILPFNIVVYILKTKSNIVAAEFEKQLKNENLWIGNKGDYIEFVFNEPQYINELRIIFDSDLNRNYVEWLDRNFQQMPHIYPLGETRFRLPETLIKKFKIEVCNENNEVSEKSYENHLRFVKIEVNQSVKFIRLIPEETWGADSFRIFSVEPI